MATILITGATGFLGKYVVDEFLRHGYQVVAHGRNATRLAQLHDQGIQTLKGDLQELSHPPSGVRGSGFIATMLRVPVT